MEKNQKKAYIFALSAVFFWSTVAAAFKISLEYLDFLQMLFYSSIFSAIVLFLVIIFEKKTQLIFKQSKKDLMNSALLGFLNPFFYYFLLFKAYDLLQAQEALSLNYTWSIMLVLLSIPLLKQKIKLASIFALLISFAGVLFITSKGEFGSFQFNNIGTAAALGSSVIWALYWILNMKDNREQTIRLFTNFLFGIFFISIILPLISSYSIPNIRGLLGTMYIGAFEMGITFVFWLKALDYSETTAKIANLIYLSPFLSLIIIYFAVGEKISVFTVIGLVLIITGIFLQRRFDKKQIAKIR